MSPPHRSLRRSASRVAAVLLTLMVIGSRPAGEAAAAAAAPARVDQNLRFTTSDGVSLAVKVGGAGPLVDGHLPARPLIVEFTPYNQPCCSPSAGDGFNYAMVHIRGTGESDGAFDALGPRTQQDVVEVLDWACHQPWSNGRIGLDGFSASAITVYNSLHLTLPCVQTAVLKSGTHELYRDLLYPGGIPNQLPALGVFAGISGLSLIAGPDRLRRAPLTGLDTFKGMFDTGLAYLLHPTLDEWWRERGMRGDVNHLPILMIDGFFDVESRGAFQAFQELRVDGAHLMVIGAHDGQPAGSGGSDPTRQRWYDRYLRDIETGVEHDPAVQLWLADGDREDLLAGRFVRVAAGDWPVPGTEWTSLYLDAARSGTSTSLNDGTLTVAPSATSTTQSYVAMPSLPSATDPYTTALLGLFNGSSTLTDMTLAEPLGLSYTTAPFATDVLSAGPASLELVVSSTAPETDLYAVVSDVSPDGTAHPLGAGRLRTAYPQIDDSRSLYDADGDVVQPYGRYDSKTPAAIGQERRYHVEFWPIGNRFRAGHRLRLHLVGVSAYHTPGIPAINTVRIGGNNGSRLLLPVLPADGTATTAQSGAAVPVSVVATPAAAAGAESSVAGAATSSADSRRRSPHGGEARLPVTGGSAPLGPALTSVVALAALVLRRMLVSPLRREMHQTSRAVGPTSA